MDDESYICVKEVAALLGYSARTIYAKVKDATNPLPCWRIGRSLRFKRSEIELWVKGQQVPREFAGLSRFKDVI